MRRGPDYQTRHVTSVRLLSAASRDGSQESLQRFAWLAKQQVQGSSVPTRPRPTPCSLLLRMGGGRRVEGALSSSSGDTEHAIDSNTLLRAARRVAMQKTDGWRACFLAPEEAKGGVYEVVSQKRARAAPLQ